MCNIRTVVDPSSDTYSRVFLCISSAKTYAEFVSALDATMTSQCAHPALRLVVGRVKTVVDAEEWLLAHPLCSTKY